MSLAAAEPIVLASPPPAARAPLRNLWALALADVLERTRRANYLVSLLVMAWLAKGMLPPQGSGYRTFSMAGHFRPEYGPACVGSLVALLTSLYFALVGFYLVRGTVARDQRTGVGAILAAARVTQVRYVAGKALSNTIVLLSMAAVAFGVALVTQQLLGENRTFDPLATAAPIGMVLVPAAFVIGAAAVLFDCMPGLRGGLGNIVWFVLIMVQLASSGVGHRAARVDSDLLGANIVAGSAFEALHAAHPEVKDDLQSLAIGVNVETRYRNEQAITFPWRGPVWTPGFVLWRFGWCGIALALVVLGSLAFDRFDRRTMPANAPVSRERWWARFVPRSETVARVAAQPSELTIAPLTFPFANLVLAELRLAFAGLPPAWYAGVLAAWIVGTIAPAAVVTGVVLPIASIWPVLVLSALGSRETAHGAGGLLFPIVRPVERMLGAAWLAGALILLGLGGPALITLGSSGQWMAVLGWLSACALLPALALALGVWTGGGKFFEVLVLFAWYVGPMHHIAMLDYTGVTAPRSAALWTAVLAIIVGLLAAAWAGRSRQVRS